MSILRRLLLCSALAIGLILIGAQTLGMVAAYRYLTNQLAQQSTLTADALSWALSHSSSPSGTVDLHELIAEMASRDDYISVRLQNAHTGAAIELHQAPPTTETADPSEWDPSWFVMEAPEVSRRFASQDGQFTGTVTVQAGAHEASQALVQGSVRIFGLVLGAGLIWAFLAAGMARRWEKRTVRDLPRHAGPRGAGSQEEQVETSQEARSIGHAIEDAHRLVQATVREQNAKIESLQSEIQRDPITRLPNRKSFLEQFKLTLADLSPEAGGHLLLFRQRDLVDINRSLSREFTDQWLRSASDRLRKLVREHGDDRTVLARISGSDFALLLPQMSAPQASLLAEQVRRELRTLRVPVDRIGLCRWSLALTVYTPSDTVSDTLARLDHALMCAESAEDDQIAIARPSFANTNMGEYSWHEALTTALQQHKFSLSVQAFFSNDGTLLHHDARLTLHDTAGAQPVPTSIFMPAAIRLGLSMECDIQSVRLAMDWLVANSHTLAVNVSVASLTHASFISRLEKMLNDRPSLAARLIVEVDALALVEHIEAVGRLCEVVTSAGAKIGVSRLSHQFSALEHLHELPVSYVKLCGGFVQSILHSPGSQHLAATVVETATALEMSVYAEDVADSVTKTALESLGIRAMRGPGINFALPQSYADNPQQVDR